MGMVFGVINEETPKFALVRSTNLYEIRRYSPYIRAQVPYNGDRAQSGTREGFGNLAGYIFGGNTKRTAQSSESIAMTSPVITENAKIAMTAPVITENNGQEQQFMSFTMPSKFKTIEELPAPNNPKVKLIQVPESVLAVVTFSGWVNEGVVKEKENELRNELKKDGVKLKNEDESAMLFQYNPPWTIPSFRKNEIALKLDEEQFAIDSLN
jgi:hypothetical protein